LAATRIWRPSKGHPVNLSEVERAVAELHVRFRLERLCFDPWQAQHMASRMTAAGLGGLVEVTPVGHNLQRIATAVIESFNDRRLELFDDADLRRDITKFRVEEKAYGFRLTSPRDSLGHGDLGTAFSLALLGATQIAAGPILWAGTGFEDGPFATFDNPFQRAAALFDAETRRLQREREQDRQDFANRYRDEVIHPVDIRTLF
jgi:hypothetical protein